MRRFASCVVYGCLGVLLLSTGALSQRTELLIEEGTAVENPPESLLLRHKFTVGEASRYNITITGSGSLRLPGQETPSKLETRTEMQAVRHVTGSIASEGIWRVEWSTPRAEMTISDFGVVQITVPSIKYEVTALGKVKKLKGIDMLAICPGLPRQKSLGDVIEQLASAGFPERALKPDDTWENTYQLSPSGQPPVTVKTVSTLQGFERVLDINCAKIHTKYQVPFSVSVPAAASESTKAATTPAPSDTDKPAAEPKPLVLKGVETGEYWTFFDYANGVAVQVFGSVELVADTVSGDSAANVPATPAPQSGPAPSAPESDPAMGPPTEPAHDVSVKYQMVCLPAKKSQGADATK